ncbi:TonB-dependent receptor [Proteiniphilum saccharofermentans]|uniref:SusC/RagA family TonB-linked outer membrane protein n=1 Tax=Proteiniphilum saccharofermentans TaxID=1642647 RepID=UPI0028B167A2|nr:TonB-dependent receptor [Proteiniphilum saccharofermentans]
MTNISLFQRNIPLFQLLKKCIYVFLILLWCSFNAYGQETIRGIVVDKDNQPLPGVAVAIKSTTTGTATDIDGNFSFITDRSLPLTLTINFLGYKTQEIDVYEANEIIRVILSEDINYLDEVVVVGYGTAKKSSYTGSVAVVGARELEKLEITSVGKALQGTVPGLQSVASAGQPGSDASLYVRGIGSVNASTSPLYVVDGVPGANPNQISGKDIQSISILKDATASALYGSRGANGVIVITTKSGNLNTKPVVNFSSSVGFTSRAVKDYEYLSANEYYELQWEAIRNTQLDQGRTAAEAAQYATDYLVDGALKVNIYGPQYPNPVGTDGKLVAGATPLWNDDWGKAISRLGIRQQYDLSVSGGSANTRYFLSGGYLNEEGWIRTAEYERFNFRTNIQSKVNNWLEVGGNASLSSSFQRSPNQSDSNTGNFANFQRLISNIYPVYERNPDGSYVLDENGNKKWDYGIWRPTTAASGVNILGNAEHAISGSKTETALISTNFNITFLNGLLLKTTASIDYRTGSSHSYSHSYYSTGVISEGAGTASRSASRTLNYTVNSFIDYTFGLGKSHSFNLLAGPEIYVNNVSSLSGSRTGFQVLGKTEPSAGSTSGIFYGTSDNYRLASWLSKLDYNLLDRYHFSASYRRDGSSRFSKESRWGDFWSVGAAWNVKKEDFLRSVKDIDNLNVRFSYGAQGNDNVGNYAYGGFYEIYNSLDMLGLLPSELPTPELKWETNLNLNFGIDISLFENRLIAQIDVYNRQSKDLLFEKPLSPSTGYSGINANIGSLSNRGIDGQITGTPIRNKDFNWDITLNFGHYTNKITKLPQEEILTGSIGQFGNTKKMVEGGSVYDFYIKEWAGVNPENGKATWYKDIVDENGNVTGRTTTEDQTEATQYFQGSSLPDFYGGLNNRISYKGFELSFLLSYSIGGKIFDGDQPFIMHLGYAPGRNWSKEALTRWTPENRDTDFPRLSYVSDPWNTIPSTRFLYSATYARLKNVVFSYSFPQQLLSNWNLSDLRLYLTGDNILTFFGHKGLDPEQTVSGSTFYRYPAQKSYSLGINVSF